MNRRMWLYREMLGHCPNGGNKIQYLPKKRTMLGSYVALLVQEFRQRKKRRQAMPKLWCFWRGDLVEDFGWVKAFAPISSLWRRYNDSKEIGCGLRMRFGLDGAGAGGSGEFATGQICTEERRVSVSLCRPPRRVLKVGNVRFLGIIRLLWSLCAFIIWS